MKQCIMPPKKKKQSSAKPGKAANLLLTEYEHETLLILKGHIWNRYLAHPTKSIIEVFVEVKEFIVMALLMKSLTLHGIAGYVMFSLVA